jgi:hypothetical protein
MNKFLSYRWVLLILVTLLAPACGDGGGDDENQISDTIFGAVFAPNGMVAQNFSQGSIYVAMLNFFLPHANAEMTGLTPVANATVELIRIDSSGAQIGDALARATTDSNGGFVMETGVHGVPPSGDVVLQTTGSNGVKMRGLYNPMWSSVVSPVSDYILDTLLSQPGVDLEVLNIEKLSELQDNALVVSNLDFSSVTTVAEAKNLMASDGTTNTYVTDGVTNMIAAASVGLPIDMSQTTATSTIEYLLCGTLGGWNYSFTATDMIQVGTDTWTDGCGLGPEVTNSFTMNTLSPGYDLAFNCANYPICTASDFNKKLQGTDDDGRAYTTYYNYDGNARTLIINKYVPEESFREVITIQ